MTKWMDNEIDKMKTALRFYISVSIFGKHNEHNMRILSDDGFFVVARGYTTLEKATIKVNVKLPYGNMKNSNTMQIYI